MLPVVESVAGGSSASLLRARDKTVLVRVAARVGQRHHVHIGVALIAQGKRPSAALPRSSNCRLRCYLRAALLVHSIRHRALALLAASSRARTIPLHLIVESLRVVAALGGEPFHALDGGHLKGQVLLVLLPVWALAAVWVAIIEQRRLAVVGRPLLRCVACRMWVLVGDAGARVALAFAPLRVLFVLVGLRLAAQLGRRRARTLRVLLLRVIHFVFIDDL